MPGISPVHPPFADNEDGHYALNKTVKDATLQNLRFLFLTNPKERVGHGNFGIGLRRYLFEQNTAATQIALENRIREQVGIYCPNVGIVKIQFITPLNSETTPDNHMNLRFEFFIKSTGQRAVLDNLLGDPPPSATAT